MSGPRVVLATRNAHKITEVSRILERAGTGVELIGLPPASELAEVIETGRTFAANALLKARAAVAALDMPAIADDSGLCVDALNGMPGVFSARWAGRHGDDAGNLRLLLAQLADVPEEARGAHFACAAALVTPAGVEIVTEGRLDGTLARMPRGSGGFGYDPVLRPAGEDRTCAELSPEEKDAISHRGAAFRRLAPSVAALVES